MLDILTVLKPILADIFSAEENDITPTTSLEDDLGADFIDMQEIMLVTEEEFDVLIDDEDLSKIQTVGDLIAYIEGHRHD